MNTRSERPPSTSASSTSTSGSLSARRLSISVCMGVIELAPLRKKSGRAPTFGTATGVCTPARKLSVEHSIGPLARERLCLHGRRFDGARDATLRRRARRAARDRGRRGSPRARGAASTPARAAGRPRDGAPAAASSGPGRTARSRWSACSRRPRRNSSAARLVALGVKQRTPERLADRGLVGLQVARPAQRHDRGLVVAVVEQLAAALIEVIDAVHSLPVY